MGLGRRIGLGEGQAAAFDDLHEVFELGEGLEHAAEVLARDAGGSARSAVSWSA